MTALLVRFKPLLHYALGPKLKNNIKKYQEIELFSCVRVALGVILYVPLCVGVVLGMYRKCNLKAKCNIADHPNAR